MRFKLYMTALLLLGAGALILGSGLTGNVISQSCCTGPDCAPEYTCDHAETAPQAMPGQVLIGAVTLGCAFVLLGVAAIRR
jgi:hypothetical protein